MTKFFRNPKDPILGAFWTLLDPFGPNVGSNEFSWKKELCQILNIPIIYHRAKIQKKLITHS